MATIQEPRNAGSPAPEDRRTCPPSNRLRWTSEEYYRLAELGFFRNRRVELVRGQIIARSSFKPAHAISVELADNTFRTAFAPGHRVWIQLPLDLGRRNQPEPDAVVLAGSPRDSGEHPKTALLVVEISDTTLRYDRLVNGHLYARAKVADYWILNLIDRQLEVYREPVPDPARNGRFAYHQQTIVTAGGRVAPLGKPGVEVAVADLLP
ncbi:MAG: Uma2 family endonuclease [Isosphaeraceae bacterium]|nr:Uma2 family endonuclease [Isosphaeraceae bacterium]